LSYVSTEEAGERLRKGEVGLVPTETVVGLLAGEAGVSRLSEIKGRDPNKPIALLCGSAEEAFALAREARPLARLLAERLWPGPLTLVLDTKHGTVGVRVPAHPAVLAVLARYGGPLYATSANLAGEPAPHALEDVDSTVLTAVNFAVWGEPGSGEASAVVDLSGGKVRLLRRTKRLSDAELYRLANLVQTDG
jgi:L-threonylcarbamoyladenylate synthase